MDPYRTVAQEEFAEAPRDAGIVGDVIAQFADPLAFYRELVQNAIDADSPSVEVELVYDGRVMLARVRDRGCGMTRDILENQLLVLFRSTKEKDDTKIGKFGIGFASVLAPNPNVVVVQTARDGRRLVLHLLRDLTYQIFDGGAATHSGTTVEVEIAVPPDDAHGFIQRSIDALVRWCRHATVPIHFRAELPGMAPTEARIDRPLGLLDAVVEVRGSSDDGQLTAIVGIAADAEPYAGFFNHGLMLYETTEPLVGRLSFKIQDARLGHTLSRDNVRRDENFTRALAMVRKLAEDELPKAIAKALREATPDVWLRIARAALATKVSVDAWVFPLVYGGVIEAGALGGGKVIASTSPSRLAAALAKYMPVVLVPEGATWVVQLAREVAHVELVDAARVYVLVMPVEMSGTDHVLVDTMMRIFEACNRAPPTVVIASLEGVHANLLSIAGGPDDTRFLDGTSYAVDSGVALSTPFTRNRRRALVLNANHALMRIARTASDPRTAATLIARGVLLQNRILDIEKSERILDFALARRGTP